MKDTSINGLMPIDGFLAWLKSDNCIQEYFDENDDRNNSICCWLLNNPLISYVETKEDCIFIDACVYIYPNWVIDFFECLNSFDCSRLSKLYIIEIVEGIINAENVPF